MCQCFTNSETLTGFVFSHEFLKAVKRSEIKVIKPNTSPILATSELSKKRHLYKLDLNYKPSVFSQ